MTAATKKPATPAVDKLTARIAKADKSRKEAKKQVAALTKLKAKLQRQLKALTAGLKLLAARERDCEKEVASLKKDRDRAKAAAKAKR